MIDITQEKARIFRITHINNVSWYLQNNLHCCSSDCRNPNFREIGNPDLIGKRANRPIAIPPGGTLSDYVSFYFTPFSMMLYNIKTGYNVRRTPMSEIVFLVSSLHKVIESCLQFVFTDRHAYVMAARFSSDLNDLDRIDWDLLQRRDFKRDPDDLAKCERYQAEALIWKLLPVSALLGIVCYQTEQEAKIKEEADRLSLKVKVITRPDWYF